jgi:glycosyltransferase involved in cell wall biosynthesis
MRILVVNAFFPPLTTGSAHFSYDVARRYAACGHDVLVLTAQPDGSARTDTIDGLRVTRLPTRWVQPGKVSFNYSIPFVFRRRAYREIRNVIREFQPDVIHQNGQFFDLTLLTSVAAWRERIPRVLTIHTPLTHTATLTRLVISAIDRTVLRFFVRLGTSRVVAVDRFTMEMCQRRYRPHGDVSFIPATLDTAGFGAGNGERVRELLDLGDRPVILSFGHVIPIRSRRPLIRAIPALIERIPDAVVVVVGQVYDTEYLRIAEELGVSDRVISVGRVPHAEVPDFLAASDLECHELDGHGIGITTFEVMAAGIPVVAAAPSNTFPDIDFNDWPALRLSGDPSPVALATRIADVLESSDEAMTEMVAQQRDFIEQSFSTEVVAGKYLALFDELTGSHDTA